MQPEHTSFARATVRPSGVASGLGGQKAQFTISKGTCFAFFAYDVGPAIDLEIAAQCSAQTAQRETIPHRRRTPKYFEYQPPPLRITQTAASLDVGPCKTLPTIDLVIYDFGAVSVSYAIDLSGQGANLAQLSDLLSDNAALLADSRRQVEQLIERIGPAVPKANISPLVEDYVIYQIDEMSPPASAEAFINAHGMQVAQVLRSERQQLSQQEIDDALSNRIAYGTDDLAVIDWQAALVIDPDAEDVRAVLEFANVELLELRYLDDRLDKVLDQSYKSLSRRRWGSWFRLHSGTTELRRLAKLQMESAVLFEEVNNALKLVGDQYLARVYRLAAQRLHIGDWDASILRKLHTVESMYSKLVDYQNNKRMELLEWIIILLIAVSILMAFFPGQGH
ncbi:MAG: hypothetical protein L0Y44_10710 [Phycisphaerales bacterium]|nr:hypothetical protein [Phycisphaerales bacterium]MCI0631109.1 hypothetical protein [Phycisphaerales bacterium]MCI0675433.1 hypothetical protein [Phycisphaerales bacterium]